MIGDHGKAVFDNEGRIDRLVSHDFSVGGNDTINSGRGDDWVIGGYGSDDITLSGGDNTVLGDNGRIEALSGVRSEVESLDVRSSTGGNDVIETGEGDDQVLAGMGRDETINAGGESIAIGDDGLIVSNADGRYVMAETGSPAYGAADRLIGGSDRDILFGGAGGDRLEGNAGEDILFGDFGRVTRDPTLITVEATSLFEGGNDEIYTGPDGDIAIGGAGGDGFSASFAEDSVVGDYGRFRIALSGSNESEQVISLVTLAQGRLDLLRSSQQGLYSNQAATQSETSEGENNSRTWLMLNGGETSGMSISGSNGVNATPGNPAIERMERLISEWQQREGSSLRGSIASEVAANVSSGAQAERMLQQNPPAAGDAETLSAESARKQRAKRWLRAKVSAMNRMKRMYKQNSSMRAVWKFPTSFLPR